MCLFFGGGWGGGELGRKAWQGVYEYKLVFLYLPIYVSFLLVAVNFLCLLRGNHVHPKIKGL